MIATLIEELQERNIRLSAIDGRLSCAAPPGALTFDLKQRIQEAKHELLEMLIGAAQSIALAEPITPAHNQESYPLSGAQRRSVMTGHPGAILPSAFRLSGPLNPEILNQTLNSFVQRHAPLRTRFVLNGQNLVQHVIPFQPFVLQLSQISGHAGNTLDEALECLQKIELDPQQGICYRFELLVMSSSEHVLFAAFSPLVFDGWSFDLFWQELTRGYAALAKGGLWPFAPLEHTYADCSSWLTGRVEQRKADLKQFWLDQLGDTLPLDVFPLAGRPNSDRKTGTLPFQLDMEATQAVRDFAANSGVTPQVILLAGIYIWSYRLRGIVDPKPDNASMLDIVFGIAVEGRPHIALESVVGPFANLILLRENISQEASFDVFVKQVQEDLLSAHQYQEFPIDRHQIRSPVGSTRSFQIEFSFQQTTGRDEHMGPLQIEQVELRSGTSAVDLTFWVKDWGERIAGAIEFRAGSFDKEAVIQWVDCYHYLLANLIKHSSIPIFQHEMLSQAQLSLLEKVTQENGTSVMDEHAHLLPFGVPGRVSGQEELYVLTPKARLEPYKPNYITSASNTEYQWPQTDTEVRLEILLHDILGERIGNQADFFACGLNSLLALRFIDKCQRELGSPVSVPVLFEHPSIVSLAAYLDADDLEADAKMLVPLQPEGNEVPLYCICGINLYRRLAVALGKKQPTYAIYVPQERDMLADKKTRSTAALAQVYWDTIKDQHQEGALRLLGFCYGGALAYEVALLAREEGFDIEQLILVDTALSQKMTRRLRSRLAQQLPPGIRKKLKQTFGMASAEMKQRLEREKINVNVLQVLSSRLDSFVPTKQYDGETIMVDSGDAELYSAWKKTPKVGWEDTLVGSVHIVELSTQHQLVLSSPNAEEIAKKMLGIFSGRSK